MNDGYWGTFGCAKTQMGGAAFNMIILINTNAPGVTRGVGIGGEPQIVSGVFDGQISQGLVQELVGDFTKSNGTGEFSCFFAFQFGIKVI